MPLRTLAFAAALAATPFAVSAFEWELDKSHTQILFSVDHLGFSTTNGAFREFDATVNLNPENIEAASVEFVIQTESIDTFWEARDEHVRGSDFLDVANHPEITFVSTAIEQTGDNTATVTGDLTIRGVTQEMTFEAELRKLGPNPFDATRQIAGFHLAGEIDRTEFGVDHFAPAVGAVVPFTVDLELGAAADAS
ncbi:MAG: YceI family protein [Pseudomonadota bacterium]